MKQLEKQFSGSGEKKGYSFTQIAETETGFIYEVISNENNSKHYEVFRRKENAQFGCISYPKSKSFGIWAWCVMDLDRAKAKLESFDSKIAA